MKFYPSLKVPDEDIPFADGTNNYVNLTWSYPFHNWKVGDSISIDLDQIRYKRSSEYIDDSQMFVQNTYSCSEDYCSRKKAPNDGCCNYHLRQFKSKIKQETSIPSTIQDVAKFGAWWNNNLATVVNGNSYFTIWLLVYDDKESKIREFQSSSNSYNLGDVKSEAQTLRFNLREDNPILYIHPKANSYASFGEIINDYSGFIVRIDVPYEEETKYIVSSGSVSGGRGEVYETEVKLPNLNPSKYLKPLDIVWVKKVAALNPYYHVGVYLGNNKVCDVPGTPTNKKGIRIRSWGEFVEGCLRGETFAYRTIIPFKHYRQIAQQIAEAESIKWREYDYSLGNQNCEHAANMFIYGIEYSKQAAERNIPGTTNKGKISLNLTNEISQTNSQLGQDYNWRVQQVEQNFRNAILIKNNWWL